MPELSGRSGGATWARDAGGREEIRVRGPGQPRAADREFDTPPARAIRSGDLALSSIAWVMSLGPGSSPALQGPSPKRKEAAVTIGSRPANAPTRLSVDVRQGRLCRVPSLTRLGRLIPL